MNNPASPGFTQLASGIYLEGLAVDYRRDMAWYSDVVGGGLHGVNREGEVRTFNPERMWTGGVMLHESGAVLSSGPGGIMWNDPDSGGSGWLINQIDGEAIIGVNEMMPDGTGGMFFGTVDIDMIVRGETPRPTALYHLHADGRVRCLVDGLGFTNGIMYDAQRQRFYLNDTFTRTWVFDVNPDFSLSNQRPFLDKEDVDGMALDVEGNVWITGFRSGFVTRITPDGEELARFDTPAEAITQIRFGGADMCDVYLTCVPGDGGDSLKEGEIPSEPNSILYRTRSDIPGMPLAGVRCQLS
ncbi:gluconolactonase [Mangrovimicrobium sediminis]|uniref:Gluconolactonase n=1 Tax=Mangrovimicrobium sediminis TaxID=2562682 RepID=A0A4Z0LU50_9GAMM|nr:SMP-30/gluconolactonase/LRE family protein [Haliea sp. SAOS-164]TGD70822.1 gluconolactonase [Haliea sp. SAOS-164]